MQQPIKLTFFLLFVFSFFAQAQQIPLLDEPSMPRFQSTLVIPQGVESHRNQVEFRGNFPVQLQDSFQLALETMRDDLDSKGLSATVLAGNGDVWSGVSGVSHEGVPMTREMYLGIGSVSKSITAACILKLEEEGLLTINDTIGRYLGNYPFVNNAITIKQLLNHTSGIYDYVKHPKMLDSMQADFSRIWTPDEVLNTFVKEPYFEAGQGWTYSNSNYLLAGLIIEKVTGQTYHEAIRQKILEPVGLGNIFLNPDETTAGTIAHVWLPYNSTKVDLDAFGITPKSVYSSAWAAGAYFAQPSQMANWMQTLLTNQVLSETSMTKMTTFVPAGNIEYGLGLMKLSNDSLETYGHQGYIIYSSLCFFDPITNLTIAVQSNDGSSTDLSPFMIKAFLLYQNLVGTKPIQTIAGNAYPNPANHTTTLELPTNLSSNYQVLATDVLGHRLTAKITTHEDIAIKLDVSDWREGIYFVQVLDETQQFVYRIVVEEN